jgi:hypothetical protein
LQAKKIVSKTERNKEISCLKELFDGLKASPPGAKTFFLGVLFFKEKYGICYIFLA